MYFVQKMGVYPKGVYMITEELEHAIRCAKTLAHRDEDDYYDWVVFEFVGSSNPAISNNRKVFETRKQLGPDDPPSFNRMERDGKNAS